MQHIGLAAEWMPHDATLLAWPHTDTDWAPMLSRIQGAYRSLIEAIIRFEPVVLLVPEGFDLAEHFPDRAVQTSIYPLEVPTNDTWVRDYGPISSYDEQSGAIVLHWFRFNGWGMKYAANLDNRVVPHLYRKGLFADDIFFKNEQMIVLEGGSIESDGAGTILSTGRCLSANNRNEFLDNFELEAELLQRLGMSRLIQLETRSLGGDDTDGHVDTLARFIAEDAIAYVSSPNDGSPESEWLKRMEGELRELRQLNGAPYRLYPLPYVGGQYSPEGDPMPATYANFLFVNGGLIVPTYGVDTDEHALAALQAALPHLQVVGVDARSFISQGGSLHCATMHLLKGTLRGDLVVLK